MDSSSADPNVAAAAASAAASAAAAADTTTPSTLAAASADPSTAAAATDASATPEQQQKDQLAACWAAAAAADAANDPSFDVFVALASAAEKSGDAAEVDRALELLLRRFPLCYGYWKKLAEAKAKLAAAKGGEGGGGPAASAAAAALAEASAVFERGLAHVGSTPELWLSFATKLISSSSSSPSEGDEEKIRAVFERAVSESGDSWGAGPLWEAYAAWEAGLASGAAASEGGGGEEEQKGPPPSSAPRRAAAVLFRGACQPIRDAEVLRSLVRLLSAPSSDATTLAVACSDLARYADASGAPDRARALLTSLGANAHATRLLAHADPEVRRHALAAVQRIVLSRDKLQYLNS